MTFTLSLSLSVVCGWQNSRPTRRHSDADDETASYCWRHSSPSASSSSSRQLFPLPLPPPPPPWEGVDAKVFRLCVITLPFPFPPFAAAVFGAVV